MKHKKCLIQKCSLTLMAFLACITVSFAQISGTVKDANGEPVIGASVIQKGTTKGVVTDINGIFNINVEPGTMLRFSSIGYNDIEETAVAGMSVTMEEGAQSIDDVVVTALGVTKQARSVGYATTRVSTDEMLRTNTINPVNALQGKVAGLNIQAVGSSGVTSSSAITIRGAKSGTKNNSPIWVIDGIVLQEGIKDFGAGTDWGSQLKNLNPDDYESVTVLKGAAATALYGSRGANGAIVIVSKGGRFGKKGFGVELSQTLETQMVYAPPMQLQNVYGAGRPSSGYESDFMGDGSIAKTYTSLGPKMEGQLKDQYFLGGKTTAFSPQPNNWKALFKPGLFSNTNIAINGGNDKASFRLSYSYTDNKGVIKSNEFNRHAISFKTIAQLNKIFSVESGFNYAFSRAQNGASQGPWDWGNNVGMLISYYMPRNLDVQSLRNNYRDKVTNKVNTNPNSLYSELMDYFHKQDYNRDIRSEQSLLAYANLKAQFAPWLDASIKGNYNLYHVATEKKEYGTGDYFEGGGSYSRGGNMNGSYNFLSTLHSGFKVLNDDLTVDLLLANEIYGNTQSESWSKSTKGGFVTPAFFAFSNSKETIIPNYSYTPRNQMTVGLSGVINLGYKEQIFLELTGRNDWLSTLTYPVYVANAKPNHSVFYPSVNASWIFNETFGLPSWMSLGKLRASWAQVGLGTSAYQTTQGYGVFNQYSGYDEERNSVLIANPNLGTLYNSSLKPEIQQSIEIGTDLRFFQERLNFDFAYYKTNTYNQILTLSSVSESGANSALINAGNIQNQGIEIQIDGDVLRNKDLRWSIGGNFTLNRGKVISLHPDIKELEFFADGYDAGPSIRAYEGGAFGVITTPKNNGGYGGYLMKYNNPNDASDPRNGKPLLSYWGTIGNPNKVNQYGWVQDGDKPGEAEIRKVIGKVEADFLWALNTTLSYKGIDLYIQIDSRVGGQYFSNAYKYASSRGSLLSSLEGRDKEHGGLERINYKGEKVYDGIMLDAVFDEGTMAPSKADPTQTVDVSGMTYKDAVEKNIIEPMKAEAYYQTLGWGMPSELAIMNNTWVALREISLGWRIPEIWTSKIGIQYLRISFSALNVGYLYNGLKDKLNPESIHTNNPLTPYDIGGVPYSRRFSFGLNLKF